MFLKVSRSPVLQNNSNKKCSRNQGTEQVRSKNTSKSAKARVSSVVVDMLELPQLTLTFATTIIVLCPILEDLMTICSSSISIHDLHS